MIISEILRNKRIGKSLSPQEIHFLVRGITDGSISEIQTAAFLTSACINGLNSDETVELTIAMRDSGDKFDFSGDPIPRVDKHSTGGVGDKISLLLVPLISACGIGIPMISGRGLGHTGGTLDKLDSIVGMKTQLQTDELYSLYSKNHFFISGQTESLVPADRIMYKIRDVTGNVDSNGLISASIMSKKLAEDLDGLVLDIKVGQGALMKDIESAEMLAESMANIAQKTGLKMRIIFTSMQNPIGRAIGNWLEIQEVLDSLAGNYTNDIRYLTEKLGCGMLLLSGKFSDEDSALGSIRNVWDSGKALSNFHTLVNSQGGDLQASRAKYENSPKAKLTAHSSGYLNSYDTYNLGLAGIMLGAGRLRPQDELDYSAGIYLFKKPGDEVIQGETIAEIYSAVPAKLIQAEQFLGNVCHISSEKTIFPDSLILNEWII